MKKNCPICGSENIDVTEKKELSSRTLFDGTDISFETVVYNCSICESDFYDEDADKEFEIARDQKIFENATTYLNELKINFKSISYIERVFGIPQRTIGRWKAGTLTSIAYAFLCLIGKLPWLIEIVEAKFDKTVIAKVLAREAENAIGEIANSHNCEIRKDFIVSSGKGQIVYEIMPLDSKVSAATSQNLNLEEEVKFYPLPAVGQV